MWGGMVNKVKKGKERRKTQCEVNDSLKEITEGEEEKEETKIW